MPSPPQASTPQVDIFLQRDIQAAQQAAKQQIPVIDALVRKLNAPLPRASATLAEDLLPLDAGHAEYKQLKALMQSVHAPVHSISQVKTPDREARFLAWKGTLPAHLQAVSRVCSCALQTHSTNCSAVIYRYLEQQAWPHLYLTHQSPTLMTVPTALCSLPVIKCQGPLCEMPLHQPGLLLLVPGG